MRTMHGAHPDLRFTIDDLVAEGRPRHDPLDAARHRYRTDAGRPPTGERVELPAIVIFRIAGGRLAERWAGWKPGFAPGR